MLKFRIIYNMRKRTIEAWTERENKLLLEYYYTMSMMYLEVVFPERTRKEIVNQVSLLTRQNRTFTQVIQEKY